MKDDQELTPLESLFQDNTPNTTGTADVFATEPVPENEADTKVEMMAEPEADTEAETMAELKADTEAETMAEPEADTEAETIAEPKADTKIETMEDLSYEELVRELEQIVRSLESGDITLDQSMTLFARGIELSRRCQNQLDAIEKKITILIEGPDGKLTEEPFSVNSNE